MDELLKRKLIDTLGLGFGLWLLGFALGMMLFPFVAVAIMGRYIIAVMLPVTLYAAYKRFAGLKETQGYYLLVGISWLHIAVAMDYVFLVKAFSVQNFYDTDIMVAYALSLLVPVAIGLRYGNK
jgi:hypothetical protein